MEETRSSTDPRRVLDALDAEAIRRRLAEIGDEERALRVLLRAALARNRKGATP